MQETGRAGRDGATSDCILFYSYADTTQLNRQIDEGEGTREQKENNRANLRRMVQYCMNEIDCRRVQVLRYFGDHEFTQEDCHKTCDNCRVGKQLVETDVTELAKDAIRLVESIERDAGVTLLHAVDVFRGSKAAKVSSSARILSSHADDSEPQIVEKGHHTLPQAGKGSSMDRGDVERLFQLLCVEGGLGERCERNRLGFTQGYVTTGPKARSILNDKQKIVMGCSLDGVKSTTGRAKGKPRAPRSRGKQGANAPTNDQDDDDGDEYFPDDDLIIDSDTEFGGQPAARAWDPLARKSAATKKQASTAGTHDTDQVFAQLIKMRDDVSLRVWPACRLR